MKVEINATNVNQIVNADVIGLNQLSALSPNEKRELLTELIEVLGRKSEELKDHPHAISPEQMRTLAEKTHSAITQIASDGNDVGSGKKHIQEVFETFRTYFGGAADILLNAVKVAQALGLGLGH